ncbi:MAG: ABC transporter permease subunit, partial [Nitrospinota bacterium]
LFPPIATVSPPDLLIRALTKRDPLLALILTYTTFSLPLTIWVLTNFFRTIPHEIYLASRVDGCTAFQSFYKVLLPLSAPASLPPPSWS